MLFKNPFLKSIFSDSDFLFDRPETINEISFESKAVIEEHILMCGDAAGMIAPLCGNGMAIAIHSAKIVSELILEYCAGKVSRNELEKRYFSTWNARFATRLWVGRHLQKLFGGERSSHFAVTLARHASPVAQFLISYTHGKPL